MRGMGRRVRMGGSKSPCGKRAIVGRVRLEDGGWQAGNAVRRGGEHPRAAGKSHATAHVAPRAHESGSPRFASAQPCIRFDWQTRCAERQGTDSAPFQHICAGLCGRTGRKLNAERISHSRAAGQSHATAHVAPRAHEPGSLRFASTPHCRRFDWQTRCAERQGTNSAPFQHICAGLCGWTGRKLNAEQAEHSRAAGQSHATANVASHAHEPGSPRFAPAQPCIRFDWQTRWLSGMELTPHRSSISAQACAAGQAES